MKRVVLAIALFSCSKKEEKPKDPPKAVEPVKPPEATPAELVTRLGTCADYVKCNDLEKPLVKAGPAVAPDVVKVAVDGTKGKYPREAAANVLAELKVKGTGMALFEAAKADADF